MSKPTSNMDNLKSSSVNEGLIGLPSEICGFKDGVYYPPKSFSDLIDFHNQCYNGLFYLLGDFQSSRDFKIYSTSSSPLGTVKNPLIIQIYISLLAILSDLRKNPKAVFSKKKEYSIPYKGNINFSKTIIKNHGLQHQTYKTVNDLNTRSLERTFLFYALRKLPSLMDLFIPKESKVHLSKIFSECQYHLQEVDLESQELSELCVAIIRKPNSRGQESRILSSCKVLAEFIIDNLYLNISSGIQKQNNVRQIVYNDFHLNLNRPFERLLKKISEKLPSNPLGEVKFSEIYSLSGNARHHLIPDVYRVINVDKNSSNERCLLILDAKHKEFASLDSTVSDGDPFIQYNRINRNDLHQLITYIRTNLLENTKGIFGFFGYIQEISVDYESAFINCNRDDILGGPNPLSFKVSDDAQSTSIYINILGLRFGSVLALLGEACSEGKSYPTLHSDIYDRLAIELVSNFFEDEVVLNNKIYQFTINNCLAGASRSLFYVYRNSIGRLDKIGYHIINKYLKINGSINIEKTKIEILLNSERVNYTKMIISPNKAFFVIDSLQDPMLIFDNYRSSEIFEEYEVNALLTRSGLAVFKNGNGVHPDSLIE